MFHMFMHFGFILASLQVRPPEFWQTGDRADHRDG